MAKRKLPLCDRCGKTAWEYTIISNEGVTYVNLCDNDASPLRTVMRYGRFEARKGKRRRKLEDIVLE